MSGIDRNGEDVIGSKVCLHRGKGGPVPAVTYFNWRLECVCMHTRKICLKGRNMRGNLSHKTSEKAEG